MPVKVGCASGMNFAVKFVMWPGLGKFTLIYTVILPTCTMMDRLYCRKCTNRIVMFSSSTRPQILLLLCPSNYRPRGEVYHMYKSTTETDLIREDQQPHVAVVGKESACIYNCGGPCDFQTQSSVMQCSIYIIIIGQTNCLSKSPACDWSAISAGQARAEPQSRSFWTIYNAFFFFTHLLTWPIEFFSCGDGVGMGDMTHCAGR